MIFTVICVLSFSLITFLNNQDNSFEQSNDSASEEMLSVQINGTGTVSPLETEI
jgi:hypothetical protein